MEAIWNTFGLALLAVPVVALILAVKASNRTQTLEQTQREMAKRIATLERQLRQIPGAAGAVGAGAGAGASPSGQEAGEREPIAVTPPPPPRPRRPSIPTAPPTAPSRPAVSPAPASASPPRAVSAPSIKAKPHAPLSLEELLSTKVIVWIASVAVALAGVFLVRYFVQRGFLTDVMKVSLAGAFGLALITTGEFARRMRYATIGQGLVAGGFPVLYAAVLASVQLYDLLPTNVGFFLLAVITAAAVFMSLRHGPLVALLGLIGGFLMPALIGAHDQSAVVLFGYLFLLQIALLALARSRRWAWVTVLALLGGLVWAAGWILFGYVPAERGYVALFLLGTVVAFITATWNEEGDPAAEKPDLATIVGWLAVPAALVLSAMLVHVGEFTTLDWAQLGLMSIAAIVLARLRGRYMPMPWIGAAVVALLLISWAAAPGSGMHVSADGMGVRFLYTIMIFGGLYAGGAYVCLWSSGRAAGWAYLCGLSGMAYLAIAYWLVDPAVIGGPWWVWTALLAGLYGALAIPVGARRETMGRQGDRATAGFIITATALAAAAAWLAVDALAYHPALVTIIWACELPIVAALAVRYRLGDLLAAAGVIGVVVFVRLVLYENVFDYPITTTPVFNWLLWGYGVPCLAFIAAGWIVRREHAGLIGGAFHAGAAVLGFVMVTLMVRHGFHPVDMERGPITLFEYGAYAAAWGAISIILGGLALRWPRPVIVAPAMIMLVAAVGAAVLGPVLVENPLLAPWSVGPRRVFNGLLFLYGLPALIALVSARLIHYRGGDRTAVTLAGLCGLGFAFVLVTLEVRHAFTGAILHGPSPTDAEDYAYSAAWIGFALTLLAAALLIRTPIKAPLRWSSLAVMLLAVGKVFLYDTRQLDDLWRVMSFLGLGVTLFTVAWVYQRFVFARRDGDDDVDDNDVPDRGIAASPSNEPRP